MQVLGYFIVFRVRQLELKREVWMYLQLNKKDKHLTHFQFPAQNGTVLNDKFEWEEENEFRFEGRMYDVIELKVHRDKVILTCVEDKKENDLLNTFEKIHKTQSHGKNKSVAVAQFLDILYLSSEPAHVSSPSFTRLTNIHRYQSPLFDRIREILTPPPKNC